MHARLRMEMTYLSSHLFIVKKQHHPHVDVDIAMKLLITSYFNVHITKRREIACFINHNIAETYYFPILKMNPLKHN